MVGYSGTPLLRKLGLKPELSVYVDAGGTLGAPLDLAALELHDFPRRLPRTVDCALLFATRRSRLTARMPVILERLSPAGMIWVCWPKKASGQPTDLDENIVRELGLSAGVVDVKVAAVDEVWSGLKFVRRLADR